MTDTGKAGTGLGADSLGSAANSISINTAEDLGGGNSAGFDSQIRFSIGTGDVTSAGKGNALFHAANVFLSSKSYGTLRAGKIAEDNMCAFDPWGCTGGASLIGGDKTTIGGLGNGIVGAVAVNAGAGYKTPTIGGFSANFVSGVVGSTTTNERKLVTLNYTNGPLMAQVLSTRGSANAAANGALGATIADPTINGTSAHAVAVGASYDLNVVKLMASRHVTKDAAGVKTNAISTYALSAPLTPVVTLLAGIDKDTKAAQSADTKKAIGANYALSKRTTLGADLYKIEGYKDSGYVLRMRHTF